VKPRSHRCGSLKRLIPNAVACDTLAFDRRESQLKLHHSVPTDGADRFRIARWSFLLPGAQSQAPDSQAAPLQADEGSHARCERFNRLGRTVRSMKTEPQRICPSCGNEFSGAMEFCPVCMLRKGIAGGVEPGESSFQEAITAGLQLPKYEAALGHLPLILLSLRCSLSLLLSGRPEPLVARGIQCLRPKWSRFVMIISVASAFVPTSTSAAFSLSQEVSVDLIAIPRVTG
jgi:hypothetical protein